MTDAPSPSTLLPDQLDLTQRQFRAMLERAGMPARLASRAAERLRRQHLGLPNQEPEAIARAEAKRARRAARP